jgi:hypothetical protein
VLRATGRLPSAKTHYSQDHYSQDHYSQDHYSQDHYSSAAAATERVPDELALGLGVCLPVLGVLGR